MKLSRWIWPLNMVGAIAVTNMACVGFCAVLHRFLFRDGARRFGLDSDWVRAFDDVLIYLSVSLASPIGLFSGLWPGGHNEPPFLVVIFVPLNAYFWGWIGESIWTYHRQNPGRILQYVGCWFVALAAVVVMVVPFWLIGVLRHPRESDISMLLMGAGILISLLFCAKRSVIRGRRLALQAGGRQLE